MTDSSAETEAPGEKQLPVLGLFRFTIEGRQAPGLFVVGWIAGLVGGSAAFVGLLAGRNVPGVLLFSIGMAILLAALILLGGSQAIERRARSAEYAGPSPVLVFAAVIVASYLAAIVVVTPLQLLDLEIGGPLLSLLGVGIQAVVVVLLLRLMVIGTEALTWSDMGVRRPDWAALRDFVWGALLAGPVLLVTAVVIFGLVSAIGEQPSAPLPPAGSTSGLLLNLFAGALIAPVYEELFFRGFTLTVWRRAAGPTTAIIRSSLLFALIHSVNQSGDTFAAALGVAVVAAGARLPVALVLGWAFQRRGSLWASIGLHATFNAILLIIAEQALNA